jgi:hypothetical protein
MQNVRPEYLLHSLQSPIHEHIEEDGGKEERRRNNTGCGYNNHVQKPRRVISVGSFSLKGKIMTLPIMKN